MTKQQDSFMDKIKYFLGLEDEIKSAKSAKSKKPAATSKGQPTINLSYFKKAPSEIKIIIPRKFSDAVNVANTLKEDIPVIINFEHLDSTERKRFMDFISGTVYSISGHIARLNDQLILLTSSKTAVTEETGKPPTARKKTTLSGNEEIIVNYITKN